MKKLGRYITRTDLMNIHIKYGDEVFKFNLAEELIINEDRINSEAKEQPSVYGFLGLLSVKLKRVMKDKEAELNKQYSSLYLKHKADKDPLTGRAPSKEFIEASIIINPAYQNKLKVFLDAEDNANSMEVCCKSFEQRANMIQTLSANIRKDRS